AGRGRGTRLRPQPPRRARPAQPRHPRRDELRRNSLSGSGELRSAPRVSIWGDEGPRAADSRPRGIVGGTGEGQAGRGRGTRLRPQPPRRARPAQPRHPRRDELRRNSLSGSGELRSAPRVSIWGDEGPRAQAGLRGTPAAPLRPPAPPPAGARRGSAAGD
ncbi:uncharacterized protein ACIB01_019426, partial [Guaruba guarouba]